MIFRRKRCLKKKFKMEFIIKTRFCFSLCVLGFHGCNNKYSDLFANMREEEGEQEGGRGQTRLAGWRTLPQCPKESSPRIAEGARLQASAERSVFWVVSLCWPVRWLPGSDAQIRRLPTATRSGTLPCRHVTRAHCVTHVFTMLCNMLHN